MRLSTCLAIATSVSMTAAAPASQTIARRSALTDITTAVGDLEEASGITAAEDALDKALGGALSKLEAKLGITFAEKLLGLSKEGASPGDLQSIGKGVYYLEEGLGINAVDDFIDMETGGAYTSLEAALGVTDLEAAIGDTA